MGACIGVQCMCRDNFKGDTKLQLELFSIIYWMVLAAVVVVHENILLEED